MESIKVKSCYTCPCYCDCCAPYCGLDASLDWMGEHEHGQENWRHSECPLEKKVSVILEVASK